jgi:hypothetical protein
LSLKIPIIQFTIIPEKKFDINFNNFLESFFENKFEPENNNLPKVIINTKFDNNNFNEFKTLKIIIKKSHEWFYFSFFNK